MKSLDILKENNRFRRNISHFLKYIVFVIAFFVSVIKEVFFDNEFDWKDIIAALTGCGFVYISVVIGVLFNFLSNLT